MAKRDYYETLGLSKGASESEKKKLEQIHISILIVINQQMLENISKKFLRHMPFFQILKKNKPMINMDMLE